MSTPASRTSSGRRPAMSSPAALANCRLRSSISSASISETAPFGARGLDRPTKACPPPVRSCAPSTVKRARPGWGERARAPPGPRRRARARERLAERWMSPPAPDVSAMRPQRVHAGLRMAAASVEEAERVLAAIAARRGVGGGEGDGAAPAQPEEVARQAPLRRAATAVAESSTARLPLGHRTANERVARPTRRNARSAAQPRAASLHASERLAKRKVWSAASSSRATP